MTTHILYLLYLKIFAVTFGSFIKNIREHLRDIPKS